MLYRCKSTGACPYENESKLGGKPWEIWAAESLGFLVVRKDVRKDLREIKNIWKNEGGNNGLQWKPDLWFIIYGEE